MKRTRRTANLKSFYVIVTLGAALGCGDGGATDDCEKVADAYAKSWQRCMRASYDDAKKTWDTALSCGKVKASKTSQVDACVSALNTLDCASVTGGTSPAPCQGALSQ
jgi:hypothetical protein